MGGHAQLCNPQHCRSKISLVVLPKNLEHGDSGELHQLIKETPSHLPDRLGLLYNANDPFQPCLTTSKTLLSLAKWCEELQPSVMMHIKLSGFGVDNEFDNQLNSWADSLLWPVKQEHSQTHSTKIQTRTTLWRPCSPCLTWDRVSIPASFLPGCRHPESHHCVVIPQMTPMSGPLISWLPDISWIWPPSPFLPPQECGTLRGSLSSDWSDTVIDGKGILGYLHGLDIEIGRLLVYAVWSVQTATAIFAFIGFFFFCKKKACGHEFLKGL